MAKNSRAVAAEVIYKLVRGSGSLTTHLQEARSRPDYQLIQELTFGTCRWYEQLSFFLESLLEKPLKSKDSDIHSLLLIGLYQLRYMRVPDHAAINETVNAARDLKKPWAKALTNAVLRNYLREQEALEMGLESAPPHQRAARSGRRTG